MKVLIWIGCFFVATILNTILGYVTGFKVGYLIFYFVVYFAAKKLCDKWDERQAAKAEWKKVAQQNVAENSVEMPDAGQARFCRKCGQKLLANSQFCRKCGTEVVVIEDGCNANGHKQNHTVSAEIEQKTLRCRKCGRILSADHHFQCTFCDAVAEHHTKPAQKKQKPAKTKYCSRCGSLIDSRTKTCTGCGKQYFRGFKFTKFSVAVIALVLVIGAVSTLCVLQYVNTQKLKSEISDLQDEKNVLEYKNSILEDGLSDLEDEISGLGSEIRSLQAQLSAKQSTITRMEAQIEDLELEMWDLECDLSFYEDYAEVIGDDGTNVYHKYGCSLLNTSNGYLILNTAAAEYRGYYRCSRCHDQMG